MGRVIPFGGISASNVLPTGFYHCRVVELKETQSSDADGKTPKLMYKLTAEIMEPAAYKGQRIFENFVIGTDDDPDAELLETWQASIGGKNMKRLQSKLNLAVGDEEDSDAFCEMVKEQEFVAQVQFYLDDGKKNAQYKDQPRNRTTAYWTVGEKPAKVTEELPATAAPKATAGKGKTATATKTTAAKPAAAKLACNFPGCKEQKTKDEMPAHVKEHMDALNQGAQATGTDGDGD